MPFSIEGEIWHLIDSVYSDELIDVYKSVNAICDKENVSQTRRYRLLKSTLKEYQYYDILNKLDGASILLDLSTNGEAKLLDILVEEKIKGG